MALQSVYIVFETCRTSVSALEPRACFARWSATNQTRAVFLDSAPGPQDCVLRCHSGRGDPCFVESEEHDERFPPVLALHVHRSISCLSSLYSQIKLSSIEVFDLRYWHITQATFLNGIRKKLLLWIFLVRKTPKTHEETTVKANHEFSSIKLSESRSRILARYYIFFSYKNGFVFTGHSALV